MKLDRWLIEKVFEPAAREIEEWTGANQWWVARLLMLVWLCACATEAIHKQVMREWIFLGVAMISVVPLIILSLQMERLEGRNKFGNWFKVWNFAVFFRYLMLITLAVGASINVLFLLAPQLNDAGFAALTIAYYFLACNRLPPRERWVLAPQGGQA